MQSQRWTATGQWPVKRVSSLRCRGCHERMRAHNGRGKPIAACFDHAARPIRSKGTFVFITLGLALARLAITLTIRAVNRSSRVDVVFTAAQTLGVIVVPATTP